MIEQYLNLTYHSLLANYYQNPLKNIRSNKDNQFHFTKFVSNMKKAGIADLPLHYGHVPLWLAERMGKLGLAIAKEKADSWKYGGRTVFGKEKATVAKQLNLF